MNTNDKDYFTLPRLYCDADFIDIITLHKPQRHYLKNVLRRKAGDPIRVFNGRDGEYLATLTPEFDAKIDRFIKGQPVQKRRVHLLFSPLKKNRMAMVLEKCTELGVTDFHPVLTVRADVPVIKPDRVIKQIIEASEQSERLSIPVLHPIQKLDHVIHQWSEDCSVHAALERLNDCKTCHDFTNDCAFLIGPVGGFTADEHAFLMGHEKVIPFSLGHNILRAETASIVCATLACIN